MRPVPSLALSSVEGVVEVMAYFLDSSALVKYYYRRPMRTTAWPMTVPFASRTITR